MKREIHGLRKTSEYVAWANIKARCTNPNRPDYENYGKRNIKMCKAWQNSFKAFYEDMGAKPDRSYSIDRIDNNKHYSCGHCNQCIKNNWTRNCQWADSTTQNNNSRRNNYIKYRGKKQTLAQWAKALNINPNTFRSRLYQGWTIKRMIETPVKEI